jgi:hypothetical protein
MQKAAEPKTQTKIHLYNQILRNWENIPENFTLNQLATACNISNRSWYSLQKQLYHMRDLGMVTLGSRKTWHKKHLHLDRWFADYLKKLEHPS